MIFIGCVLDVQCVRNSKFCFFVSLSFFSSITQLGDFGDLSSVFRGPYYKPELNNQRSLTTTPLQCLQLQRPSKRGEERNSTAVRCVPIHSLLLLIWKLMCSLTLERSRSVANSVNTNAQRMVTSRLTCLHIQERSLSLACSVSSPAQQLVTSKYTC